MGFLSKAISLVSNKEDRVNEVSCVKIYMYFRSGIKTTLIQY